MRREWDQHSICEKLRQLKLRKVPLAANYVMKNHHRIFSAALHQFGSWNRALITAGLMKRSIPRLTRLGLLHELGDLTERKAELPARLKLHLEHYFGSVGKAERELKTNPKILNGWSKPKIIAVIKELHCSGSSLKYSTVRAKRTAVTSAAEAYFGSWGRALRVAGIRPESRP